MRVGLETPAGFSFPRTVFSHGWYSLDPFRVEAQGQRLSTAVTLPRGGACAIRLSCEDGRVVLETPGRPGQARRRALVRAARRILNLDLDLAPYYAALDAQPGLGWIAEVGAGRLLRGATLFEDLLKLVLTTNCSWALTRRMVASLVDLYGDETPDGRKSFPRPERLARAGERAVRERVRAGYRAPLLVALARRVARGEVDLEAWEGQVDLRELKREMLDLPGVGPYVAENLLRLLGRPDGLALDSWLRAKYARVYHGGRGVRDRTIARRYARYGQWAGLVLWCDMTRDWFE